MQAMSDAMLYCPNMKWQPHFQSVVWLAVGGGGWGLGKELIDISRWNGCISLTSFIKLPLSITPPPFFKRKKGYKPHPPPPLFFACRMIFLSNNSLILLDTGFVHLDWKLPISSTAFFSGLRQGIHFKGSESATLSDWTSHCCGSPSEYIWEI